MKKLPSTYAELLQPELAGLSPYEPELAKAKLCLDANESPYEPSAPMKAKLAALAGRIALNRYPDPAPGELAKLAKRHFRIPSGAEVIFGNGSDELIVMLCTVFAGVDRRRSRIMVPEPTFSMYRHIGRSLGFEVVGVPLDERFDLDKDAWTRALVRKPPNLIFLASPNNPTGNSYDPDVILWLIRNSGSIVVVDEAYGDYGSVSFADQVGKEPNLVVLKTLSKVGLAALRLGMAFSNPAIAREMEKVRLPYNVSTFSQRVAEIYFRNPAEHNRQTRELVRERSELIEKMQALEGLEVFRTDANFILFRPRCLKAGELHRALLKAGIRIRNLSRPGPLEECLRVTIGTPAQNRKFAAALARIVK